MFVMYALLGEGAPAVSTDSLAADLNGLFGGDEGFSLAHEKLPFKKSKTLALRWGKWLTRLAYEEGNTVLEDSAEISRILGPAAPPRLAAIDRRVSVVFDDDDAEDYTNEVIRVLDYLRGIKGVVIFDPTQKDIYNP